MSPRRSALLSILLLFVIVASRPSLRARATGQATEQTSTREPLGNITLAVDASHAPQKILQAHEEIPVKPGELTLYYPKWIPGEHMPDGPIINVAGMFFNANGKTLPWRRDPVRMFSFQLDIPQGVTKLDIHLDFLLSAVSSGFTAGASADAWLDVLNWNQVLLYPAGYSIRKLTYVPSLKIPSGWNFGTALAGAKRNGDTIDFAPVTLNMLIDSPVLSGRYFREIDLTPGQTPNHFMDIAADSPAALAMPPEMERDFRQLVAESGALFHSRHYHDYHFLLTLSDNVAHFGLEHHQSSDDRTSERSLIDPAQQIDFASLLPHEFTHSWNGKYRRPLGLATANYQKPMIDSMLWVYEGLTEYLGSFVLTARSGLLNQELTREGLALLVSDYEHRPGRDWRPLQDTATSAPFLYNAGLDWSNWRRGTDFYEESQMLWLDVDDTIRHLTNDQKSMNDFCREFYAGGPPDAPALTTYTFGDIVAALNKIAPYDWAHFLRYRLDSLAPKTPSESIENAGWKLVYNDTPNAIQVNEAEVFRVHDLTASIGVLVQDDGTVIDVIDGGPSYNAGIGPGMKIVAVEDHAFSPGVLKRAMEAAERTSEPIQMLIANGDQMATYPVDYHGGVRFPHLVREEGRPDYLSEILLPLAPPVAATNPE
jgi:predicted metalloprotease with PDZ domain